MNNVNMEVIGYLSALFNQLRAKAIEKIDLLKVVEFVNDKFRIQLDPKNMEEILNKIDIVSDISDDIITIAGKEEENADEEAMDNVEDQAAEQAYDNLTSESFVGKELDIHKIKLNESMEDYYILKGAKDNNINIIACSLDTKTHTLRCKLKDKPMFVNIDLKVI